jgi:hypothetical protein
MKTLAQFSEELNYAIGQPGAIADLGVELAAAYGSLTDELIRLEISKALFFDTTKFSVEKPLSDQATLAKYIRTKEGERYIILKMTLRAYEKLLASTRTHTFIKNQEAHNTF